MTYARQRQDLLDFNVLIPYQRLISKKPGYIQLKSWVPVLAYNDDEGKVFTQCGVFDSIDLDYRGKTTLTIKVEEA